MEIPRIKEIKFMENYKMFVSFYDGSKVIYDVMEDIKTISYFKELLDNKELFESATIDESKTVVTWNEMIDLPSDTIKEYGIAV